MGNLNCGHEGHGVCGWTIGGQKISLCGDCAYGKEKENLLLTDKVIAYVDGDDKYIVSFPGAVLGNITEMHKIKNSFVDGHRSFMGTTLYHVRVTDIHGQKWYGKTFGAGCYVKLRKAKKTGKA